MYNTFFSSKKVHLNILIYLSLAFLISCGDNGIPPEDENDKIVDVKLEDRNTKNSLILKIPSRHIVGGSFKNGGVVSNRIHLKINFYDLNMSVKEINKILTFESKLEEEKRVITNNTISILLKSEEYYIPNFINNVRKSYSESLIKEDFGDEHLDLYVFPCEPNVICSRSLFVHYITNEKYKGMWVTIDCPSANENTGCEASSIFRDFKITYLFKKSQIQRWHEIDNSVRNLLNSLI